MSKFTRFFGGTKRTQNLRAGDQIWFWGLDLLSFIVHISFSHGLHWWCAPFIFLHELEIVGWVTMFWRAFVNKSVEWISMKLQKVLEIRNTESAASSNQCLWLETNQGSHLSTSTVWHEQMSFYAIMPRVKLQRGRDDCNKFAKREALVIQNDLSQHVIRGLITCRSWIEFMKRP